MAIDERSGLKLLRAVEAEIRPGYALAATSDGRPTTVDGPSSLATEYQ